MERKKDLKYTVAVKPNWIVTVDLKIKCKQRDLTGEVIREMDFSFEYLQYAGNLAGHGERTVELARQIAAKFFIDPSNYYIKSITLKNHD